MFEALELFDRALLLKINALHTPLADTFMWGMSQSWHTYLFVAVITYALYKKHSAKKAAEFLLGCALIIACADSSSNIVKHQVKRYRPTHNLELKAQIHKVRDYKGGEFGFFSGHAANSFGLTVFVFFCVRWVKTRYKLLLFLYPLLISYSRIYLGVHYPSDVFVGAIVGLLFGSLLYFIMEKYFFKLNETRS